MAQPRIPEWSRQNLYKLSVIYKSYHVIINKPHLLQQRTFSKTQLMNIPIKIPTNKPLFTLLFKKFSSLMKTPWITLFFNHLSLSASSLILFRLAIIVVGSFSSCSSNSFWMLQEAFTNARLVPAPEVLGLSAALLTVAVGFVEEVDFLQTVAEQKSPTSESSCKH